MTPSELAEVIRNADILAARYKRRCWWADVDDLRQEGLAAQLQCRSTWDPDYGVPFGAYAWRAAALAMRAFLLRMSAPVSAPRGHGELLVGLQHAPIEDARDVENGTDPRKAFDVEDHRARVRGAVAGALTAPAAEYAWATLGGDFTPRDVAAYYAIPAKTVYAANVAVRDALRGSSELFDTWQEWSP